MRRILLTSVVGLALLTGASSLAQAHPHGGGFGGFGGGFGGGHFGGGFGGHMMHHGMCMPGQPLMQPAMPYGACPGCVPYTPAPTVVSQPVVEESEETSEDGGVRLTRVRPDGPADQGGLRAGDVLLSVGGVRTRTFAELRSALTQADDDEVEVIFINGENGQTESLTVTPEDSLIGVTCE